jgi:hypothetical protein
MLNHFPIVRKQSLSVAASLLACIIFTALLALQQWDTRIKICPAGYRTNTYSSTTARDLHTVPF